MNVTYSSVKSLSNLGSLLINWDKGDNSTVMTEPLLPCIGILCLLVVRNHQFRSIHSNI